MDKTLLRPLFQKRFMELHKPKGFFVGGVAMQADQARGRQSGVMSLAQDNIYTDPNSGVQQKIDVQPNTSTQDVNINESIVMGRENQQALDAQDKEGIMTLSPQNVDPEKLQYFEESLQQTTKPKKSSLKDQKESLFSEGERRGLFAANVALALANPGDPLANLGAGLAGGAIQLANLKQAEAEMDAQKIKFDKTKEVYDTATGKNTLATEAEIQTSLNPDGTRRFEPKRDTAKKSFKMQKVYDNQLGKNTFVSQEDLYKSIKSGEDRYGIASDGFVSVIFNEDTEYGDEGKRGFVPKFAIQNNPQAFRPLQKDTEQIIEGIIAKESTKANRDRIKNTTNQLFKAREANAIIKTIKKDLIERGAKGGTVGQLMQTVAGAQGFLSYFNPFTQEKNFADNKKDLTNAIFDPEKYFNDPNVNITREERRRILALSKKIRNNKGLAGLFDSKNQAASAAMRTSVVNLAYALAKSREEGGRFSVTDIELAMRTIGDSSNKTTFLSSLNRTGLELLRPAINNYLDAQSIANPDVDPQLPKRLQFLMQDLQYYDDPDKEEALRKLKQKKQLDEGDITIPPLNQNPQPIGI